MWDVYGFFAYRLGSREDVEDLTQLTFERALRAWRSYDERRAPLRVWLLAIARNLLIDHLRRDTARERPSSDDQTFEQRIGLEPSPEETGLGLSPDLERAIEALSVREREVLALRFGGDLSGSEIAELTGLSLANVHQISSRALRSLKDSLEAPGAIEA